MNLQQNLGALELNGAIIQSDTALERAASAGPTTMGGCPTLACRHIDDASLETVGTQRTMQPTAYYDPGRCRSYLDDVTLETAAGHVAIGPTPGTPWTCGHIGDEVLESMIAGGKPLTIEVPVCFHRIGDEALEATVSAGPNYPTAFTVPCRHIDDGALEGTARERLMGPTRVYLNGHCR